MDSRIESLRPEAQAICSKWLHIVRDDLQLEVKILETLRTHERQEEMAKTGKSLVSVGWHNVGLAWDFAVFHNGVYLTDDGGGQYTKCGQVGEMLGCTWGGRWQRLKDYGHLEYHPGMTLQQFLNGEKGGLVA